MKKFVKYLLLALGIFSLMLISETLYTVKHRSDVMQSFYLVLARQAALAGNIKDSINFLNNSAQLTIDINLQKNPVYSQIGNPKMMYDSTNKDFNKEYKDYLAQISGLSLNKDKSKYISQLFYNLALIAYKTGEKSMVVYFLQKAIFIDPFFSYYHVELANYYLAEGDTDSAKKVLDICSNVEVTSEHCKEYLKDNYDVNYPENVGFLQQRIITFIAN